MIDRIAYTVLEAAEAMGVCAATIRKWIRTGHIKKLRTPGPILIAKKELERVSDDPAPQP